ncbi:MAG: pilus assembly protein N-terminal domain-containing protein [Alphaproteobacteria bacterium]
MNAKLPSVIGLGIALSLVSPSAARADTNTLFILDGSNSMWGQVEGVAKIQTAKEVLGFILGQLPPDTNAGLMSYGHNREADCTDVEVLTPIGEGTPAALLGQLGRIVPKGKTPIALALETAADQFANEDDKNNVVLISDGVPTCNRNACEVAAELAARDISVTIHVVGFDVSDDERALLQCIADAGGGRYFNASDTESIEQALAEVAEVERAEAPPAAEPEPERVAEPEPEGPEPLRVVIDKARLMRLDADASTVMVANPDVADVAVETSRMIFVLGRQIGETNFFVLDAQGNEIFHSDLVVVPNLDREVTLHRNTAEETLSCEPRCGAIDTPSGKGAAAATAATSSSAAGDAATQGQ